MNLNTPIRLFEMFNCWLSALTHLQPVWSIQNLRSTGEKVDQAKKEGGLGRAANDRHFFALLLSPPSLFFAYSIHPPPPLPLSLPPCTSLSECLKQVNTFWRPMILESNLRTSVSCT